jgi:hypothetical protein
VIAVLNNGRIVMNVRKVARYKTSEEVDTATGWRIGVERLIFDAADA